MERSGDMVKGVCKFCGQQRMIEEDTILEEIRCRDIDGQEAADLVATEMCTCREGQAYRDEIWTLKECQQNIEEMFREEYPEIADTLQEVKLPIYQGRIKKLTLADDRCGVTTMKKRGTGITITHTKKSTTTLETNW